MNRLGIYQRFRNNSDFGARPKKKFKSKTQLAMPPKNTGKSSPSKNRKGKERARQDDALNEALRDVADELAAVPGSPSPAMAKAEALEKRIKELEAEGKVIHLLFSN